MKMRPMMQMISGRKKALAVFAAATLLLCACSGSGASRQPETSAAEETTANVSAGDAASVSDETQDSAGASASQEETAVQTDAAAEDQQPENGEDSVPDILHLTTTYESIVDTDPETSATVLTMSVQGLKVNDEKYAALCENVGAYWDAVWDSVQEQHADYYAGAQEFHNDMAGNADAYYSIAHTSRAVRSDETLLSFLHMLEGYTGGAHGFYEEYGVTYDTQTGERLTLAGIAADYDGIYETVRQELETKYAADGALFDDYAETLQSMFYGEEQPEWTVDRTGVTIYFNTYVIAPYAVGPISVSVTFAEHPDYFKPEYISQESGYIRQIDWGCGDTDLTGDGAVDYLYVGSDVDGNNNVIGYYVSLNDETVSRPDQAQLGGSWVIGDINGRIWCYVQLYGDNEWPHIDIYELTGGAPAYVDTLQSMKLSASCTGPENFCLASRLDFLGSYMGYEDYDLKEDGLPSAHTETYAVYDYGMDGTLTAKCDLPALAGVNDYGTGGSEATVPAGTVLHPVRTDGKSWMTMRSDSGEIYRFDVEGDSYGTGSIGGIPEEECFDGLFYAG